MGQQVAIFDAGYDQTTLYRDLQAHGVIPIIPLNCHGGEAPKGRDSLGRLVRGPARWDMLSLSKRPKPARFIGNWALAEWNRQDALGAKPRARAEEAIKQNACAFPFLGHSQEEVKQPAAVWQA